MEVIIKGETVIIGCMGYVCFIQCIATTLDKRTFNPSLKKILSSIPWEQYCHSRCDDPLQSCNRENNIGWGRGGKTKKIESAHKNGKCTKHFV